MVTTVGTQDDYGDLLGALLKLEHDAIAAYETTLEKLESVSAKTNIQGFLDDHHRHVQELKNLATEAGVTPPDGGSMKEMLTTGKVQMASLMGDDAVIGAMRSNEEATVAAYERAKQHEGLDPKARDVFARAYEDECRHRDWMHQAAQAA